jgi:hypothetical protein
MNTETTIRKMETRKGMRQPQSAKASRDMLNCTSRITLIDRNRPSVAVVWIKLVKNPRRCVGEYSATYVAAPPYSPPSARPCNSRSTSTISGAAAPMVA